MADEPPPDVQDLFDDAWQSAQSLAIDVMQYPAEKPDAVVKRMRTILTEIASEAGCPREMARGFGAAMKQTIANTSRKLRQAVVEPPAPLSEVVCCSSGTYSLLPWWIPSPFDAPLLGNRRG
jgi:hypothetical protein